MKPALNSTVSSSEWEELTLTVDSGASETVLGRKACPQIPIRESAGSQSGVEYETASGEHIPNEGEKVMQVSTTEGQLRTLTMQICDVKKPLMSVRKMCAVGQRVVFDDEWSYVEDKTTGDRTTIEESGGVYTMKVWVRPPQPYVQGGFPWPGQ